ncbi:MAG: MBL fold metallo-hydrolase [Halobacteria archaeon]|nr:MBL fold metallo-hydrolase [Halobacteria archaeon]
MTAIHRVGTSGSQEGENSAYVLPDHRAVIDPGYPSDESWQALCRGIRETDLDPSDVEHVLVTHWHVDHAGLAPRLAKRADAKLHFHEKDAPLVGNYKRERDRRLRRDRRELKRWGVPEERIDNLLSSDTPSPIPDTFPVNPHTDGDEIEGISLIHTPGHTLGHAAFAVQDAIFVGDAVLPTYTPNIGGSDTRVKDALKTYINTLERLRSFDGTAYPGHGTVLSLSERIDEIEKHHVQRSRDVLEVVRKSEEVTPWEVATRLFGEMKRIHTKMGAGEAASHLLYLKEVGTINRKSKYPLTFSLDD